MIVLIYNKFLLPKKLLFFTFLFFRPIFGTVKFLEKLQKLYLTKLEFRKFFHEFTRLGSGSENSHKADFAYFCVFLAGHLLQKLKLIKFMINLEILILTAL